MIRLAPFQMARVIFANGRRIFPLQPHFHKIECLHPNVSIKIFNILSLINHHYIFRFWADQVGTLSEWMWIWSKDRSKQKVCIFSTKFRWSPMIFTLEFLHWSLASGKLSQPWMRYSFVQNHMIFSCVHIEKLREDSYQGP